MPIIRQGLGSLIGELKFPVPHDLDPRGPDSFKIILYFFIQLSLIL